MQNALSKCKCDKWTIQNIFKKLCLCVCACAWVCVSAPVNIRDAPWQIFTPFLSVDIQPTTVSTGYFWFLQKQPEPFFSDNGGGDGFKTSPLEIIGGPQGSFRYAVMHHALMQTWHLCTRLILAVGFGARRRCVTLIKIKAKRHTGPLHLNSLSSAFFGPSAGKMHFSH